VAGRYGNLGAAVDDDVVMPPSRGRVSAELLQTSGEFRKLVIDTIEAEGGSPSRALLDQDIFDPRDWTVVFAIVGTWTGRPPSAALPFFTRIHLRQVADALAARGFRVEVARIEALDP
jgi:uncharacterized protein (TIGR04141 family)